MQRFKDYMDKFATSPVTTLDLAVLVVAYSIGYGVFQVLFS